MSSNERQRQIFSEQVKLLFEQTKTGSKINFIPPLIIALIVSRVVDTTILVPWLVSIQAASLIKLYLVSDYAATLRRDEKRWVNSIIVTDVLYCAIGSALFVAIDIDKNFLISVVGSGVLLILSSSMAQILASVSRAYVFPCLAIHLPVAAKSFLVDMPEFDLLGVCYLIGAVQFIGLSRNIYKTILESIELRFEKSDLIAELDKKRVDAEQANRAKTQFLAAASHDLRQPLHTMSLFIEILNQELTQSDHAALLDKIAASSESLTNMLNTLLDISKLDANTVEVNPIHLKLDALVSSVVNDFVPLATQKGISITMDVAENTYVYTDLLYLERILRNLVGNAVKFCNQGGVIVSCVVEVGGRYTLSISDTGIGIPEHALDKVFDEYYQVNNPERDRKLGLGLGLSIVKRLCQLLGTEIRLKSIEHKGTVATLLLPAGDSALIKPAREPIVQNVLKNLQVLVVDDQKDILLAMRLLLERWGCATLIAQSLEESLSRMEMESFTPDIIISDYRLREKENGFHVIDVIRNKLQNQQMPAILLTGDTTPEVVDYCRQAGLLLIYKPIKPAKLHKALQHCRQELSDAVPGKRQ